MQDFFKIFNNSAFENVLAENSTTEVFKITFDSLQCPG